MYFKKYSSALFLDLYKESFFLGGSHGHNSGHRKRHMVACVPHEVGCVKCVSIRVHGLHHKGNIKVRIDHQDCFVSLYLKIPCRWLMSQANMSARQQRDVYR